jgi:arginase family enzyme
MISRHPRPHPAAFWTGDGLAAATQAGAGRRWLPGSGFSPLLDDHIIHIGGNDFDPGERELLDRSGLHWSIGKRPGWRPGNALEPALLALKSRYTRCTCIDLDVLDPQITPVSQFLPTGGLTVHRLKKRSPGPPALRLGGAGLASPTRPMIPRTVGGGPTFMEALTVR